MYQIAPSLDKVKCFYKEVKAIEQKLTFCCLLCTGRGVTLSFYGFANVCIIKILLLLKNGLKTSFSFSKSVSYENAL